MKEKKINNLSISVDEYMHGLMKLEGNENTFLQEKRILLDEINEHKYWKKKS